MKKFSVPPKGELELEKIWSNFKIAGKVNFSSFFEERTSKFALKIFSGILPHVSFPSMRILRRTRNGQKVTIRDQFSLVVLETLNKIYSSEPMKTYATYKKSLKEIGGKIQEYKICLLKLKKLFPIMPFLNIFREKLAFYYTRSSEKEFLKREIKKLEQELKKRKEEIRLFNGRTDRRIRQKQREELLRELSRLAPDHPLVFAQFIKEGKMELRKTLNLLNKRKND